MMESIYISMSRLACSDMNLSQLIGTFWVVGKRQYFTQNSNFEFLYSGHNSF